jgi:hypothetical protein
MSPRGAVLWGTAAAAPDRNDTGPTDLWHLCVALAQQSKNPYSGRQYSAVAPPNPTEAHLDSVLAWLQRQVQTVPPHLAVCEFDCRRPQCHHRDWDACTRVRHGRSLQSLPLATLTHTPSRSPSAYTDA